MMNLIDKKAVITVAGEKVEGKVHDITRDGKRIWVETHIDIYVKDASEVEIINEEPTVEDLLNELAEIQREDMNESVFLSSRAVEIADELRFEFNDTVSLTYYKNKYGYEGEDLRDEDIKAEVINSVIEDIAVDLAEGRTGRASKKIKRFF